MSEPPRTVPAYLARALERHADRVMLEDREGTVTFAELCGQAARAAEGLRRLGVAPGDRVAFYADNSRRWILTDLALQLARAVSVPRGTDTPLEEYLPLVAHAEARLALAHSARHARALAERAAEVPGLDEVISIDPAEAPGRTLDDLIALGAGAPSFAEQARAVRPDDLATIIYTSGTTGRPKGVMLTQSNFGHQVAVCPGVFRIGPDERFLSVLPPWHIFERSVEYIALTAGARVVYTDRRRFKEDLAARAPTFVPSVPRIWETVYDAVQRAVGEGSTLRRAVFRGAYAAAAVRADAWDRARGHTLRMRRPRGLALLADGIVRLTCLVLALLAWLPDRLGHALVFRKIKRLTGERLRGAISGGGLMPRHIDRFFRRVGLPVLVGYGLTETSPVVSVRREARNVLGSIGVLVPEVEVEIRHPETGRRLGPGETGLVFTRGPHVMKGYYKDPELTAQVLGPDGWLNTGDLGCLTEEGDLCFRGRHKETIVLRGGENVEPGHVEEALRVSPLIAQAIVVGQDRKTLAALLVPDVEALARRLGLGPAVEPAALAARPDALALLRREAQARTAGLKPYEQIHRIALLPEALDVANGCLTQTLKPRRHVIVERFRAQIEEAYR